MTSLDPSHPLSAGLTADSRLVRSYQGERQEVVPMLDACLEPAMASEITLQPVRRHGVDAGIFFSDIVVPLKLAGVAVEIQPGRGPVFEQPVRTTPRRSTRRPSRRSRRPCG